jgi:hypothetical protein
MGSNPVGRATSIILDFEEFFAWRDPLCAPSCCLMSFQVDVGITQLLVT